MEFTNKNCSICEEKMEATEKIILFGHAKTPYVDFLLLHPKCCSDSGIDIKYLERLPLLNITNIKCYICNQSRSLEFMVDFELTVDYCVLRLYDPKIETYDSPWRLLQTGRQLVCAICFKEKENSYLLEVLNV